MAHTAQSRTWRRELAEVLLDEGDREAFLRMLEATADIVAAAEQIGVTAGQIYGRMRWDAPFRDAVDEMLAKVCRAKKFDRCGSAVGYKRGGRCRACKTAHHSPR
ncbi:hypothetical protein ADL03_15325 [Nocardia sp. NRRL S-836]|nr:hypothetical protein ADL03_15325 [Nocardia sp. NRRL S-836]